MDWVGWRGLDKKKGPSVATEAPSFLIQLMAGRSTSTNAHLYLYAELNVGYPRVNRPDYNSSLLVEDLG